MRARIGASAKHASRSTLRASIVVDPAVPMFHSSVPPATRAPGVKLNSRLSTWRPSSEPPHRAAQASTLRTCWGRSPGFDRRCRTFVIRTDSCGSAPTPPRSGRSCRCPTVDCRQWHRSMLGWNNAKVFNYDSEEAERVPIWRRELDDLHRPVPCLLSTTAWNRKKRIKSEVESTVEARHL
jgi:hypothetical protein